MGWILIHPANDTESIAATTQLIYKGICKFDSLKSGARLRPVEFGSRCCLPQEHLYH